MCKYAGKNFILEFKFQTKQKKILVLHNYSIVKAIPANKRRILGSTSATKSIEKRPQQKLRLIK